MSIIPPPPLKDRAFRYITLDPKSKTGNDFILNVPEDCNEETKTRVGWEMQQFPFNYPKKKLTANFSQVDDTTFSQWINAMIPLRTFIAERGATMTLDGLSPAKHTVLKETGAIHRFSIEGVHTGQISGPCL